MFGFLKLLKCVFGRFRMLTELFQVVAVVQVILGCFRLLETFKQLQFVHGRFFFLVVSLVSSCSRLRWVVNGCVTLF